MLKQTVTFTDFNGNTRTAEFYFNLSESELIDMELESEKGLQAELQDAVDGEDHRKILAYVKYLIGRSYGEKSADGLRFEKSPSITEDFRNHAAYNEFLMGLFEDGGKKGEAFIKGILPADLVRRAAAKASGVKSDYEPTARERFEQRQREKNVPAAEEVLFEEAGHEPVEEIESASRREARERAEFEAWKASREAEGGERDNLRPPHEG